MPVSGVAGVRQAASAATSTRKTPKRGKHTDTTPEPRDNPTRDDQDPARKSACWALKDATRADKQRILKVKDPRRSRASSTIALHATRDPKGKERKENLSIRPLARRAQVLIQEQRAHPEHR
jgi:hypothetical protein